MYRILDILISKVDGIIKWPSLEEAKRTASYFKRKNNFPGIIGCIDGSHIPIAKPAQQHEAYINRKGFHSLILQAVCSEKRKFIDVECGKYFHYRYVDSQSFYELIVGYPGSMHDARVLRRTYLGQILQNNPEEIIFTNEMHLLGDSAYPLSNSLLTPYRDNGNLNQIQKRYNFKLSSNRIRIEHAFGILKARFRILKYINVHNTSNIPKIILACCILHNLCIDVNDEIEQPEYEEEEPICECLDAQDRVGNLKRDYIANLI